MFSQMAGLQEKENEVELSQGTVFMLLLFSTISVGEIRGPVCIGQIKSHTYSVTGPPLVKLTQLEQVCLDAPCLPSHLINIMTKLWNKGRATYSTIHNTEQPIRTEVIYVQLWPKK